MLKKLNIMKRLVSNRNVGILRCITNDDGHATISNGRSTYEARIEQLVGLRFTVDATKFIASCVACGESPKFSVSKHFLSITGNKTRARLTMIDGQVPSVPAQGREFVLTSTFLGALRKVSAFVSDDQSRQWACSVLVDGSQLFATDNTIVVRAPAGIDFGVRVSLPAAFVSELLRTSALLPGSAVRLAAGHIWACFDGGGLMLRSPLHAGDWPDAGTIIDRSMEHAGCNSIDSGLVESIHHLVSISEDQVVPRINICNGKVTTTDGANSFAEIDAPVVGNAQLHAVPLVKMLEVADCVDFSQYPRPMYFYGDGIDGVITGLR